MKKFDTQPLVVVDREVIENAMRKKGYRTTKELAQHLGLHRNTLGGYLAGARAVPEALEKILEVLSLDPAQALRLTQRRRKNPALTIAKLVDQLSFAATGCCIVLFGSRARGTPKKYSDFDLGVFSEKELVFKKFSSLLNIVADWNDNSLSTVQLSNLSIADQEFLSSIANDLIFLGGSFLAWTMLLRQAGIQFYEG
jgi:predicted nucleotidyltransferase